MKRVYVASASKGSRGLLRLYVNALASHHFVFAPMLGFNGMENPEIREYGMAACFYMVREWSEVVIALNENVETKGVWEEVELAELMTIPMCIFSPFGKTLHFHLAYEVDKFRDVLRWINGL